jgi:hypothetical protein
MNYRKSPREIISDIANGYCALPYDCMTFGLQYNVGYAWKVRYWSIYEWQSTGNQFAKGMVLNNIVPITFGEDNAIPWKVIADIDNLQLITGAEQTSKGENLDPFTLYTLHKLAVKFNFTIKRIDSKLKTLVDKRQAVRQQKYREKIREIF